MIIIVLSGSPLWGSPSRALGQAQDLIITNTLEIVDDRGPDDNNDTNTFRRPITQCYQAEDLIMIAILVGMLVMLTRTITSFMILALLLLLLLLLLLY